MAVFHDISLTIHPGMPIWPGDPAVQLERIGRMEEGAEANVSQINLCVHTGTHVDAPFHFLPGQTTVDQLDLHILIGPACVVEIPVDCTLITVDVLHQSDIPTSVVRLLFKTRNSAVWSGNSSPFQKDFVALDLGAANFLIRQGVKLVGVDYLSVAPFSASQPTHIALLSAGVVILEGLDLSVVPPGLYQLICLPLKIGGCDGAPARAILIE